MRRAADCATRSRRGQDDAAPEAEERKEAKSAKRGQRGEERSEAPATRDCALPLSCLTSAATRLGTPVSMSLLSLCALCAFAFFRNPEANNSSVQGRRNPLESALCTAIPLPALERSPCLSPFSPRAPRGPR